MNYVSLDQLATRLHNEQSTGQWGKQNDNKMAFHSEKINLRHQCGALGNQFYFTDTHDHSILSFKLTGWGY